MSGMNLISLVWLAVALFSIGIIVLMILKFFKKDTALQDVERNIKEGNYKKALTQALKYVTTNPNDFLIKFYIGQAYEGLKDFRQAVTYYEKASIAAAMSSQEEVKAQIFLKVAELYKKTKKYNESMGYFVLVLDKEPKNLKALMGISDLLFETQNYKKAKEYLETFVKIKADNVRARYMLAKVYTQVNNMSEAAAQLEYILENVKVNDEVLINNCTMMLGDVYLNMKNYSKAVNVYKEMMDKEAYAETVLVKIIDIYIKMNQVKDAVIMANQNLGKLSREKECEVHYMIAAAYLKENEVYKAALTWEKAYKLNQNYKDLRGIISRYSYLLQNPGLAPLFSKSDGEFESFSLKLLKTPYIKQTLKKDNYWAFESGDKSYVIYRRPFPITVNELSEIEKVMNQNFRANTKYVLYALYGVTNENNTSNTTYNADKMDLISDNDFIKAVNEIS